jgi:ribose transport system substrate-binding protein
MLGLDLKAAGTLVLGRISGAFEAVREVIPSLALDPSQRMDGGGQFEVSRRVVGEFLDRHPAEKRILIAAATDTSALGAVAAVRQRKRTRHVAIAGLDCISDAVSEMSRPDSPLIGTISHEPATYGPTLMHLALELLKGQPVPPYNYVSHKTVSRTSILKSESY